MLFASDTYTWTIAGTTGGTGSYEFRWYIQHPAYDPPGSFTYAGANSAPTFQWYADACDGDIRWKVEVLSGGQLATTEEYIWQFGWC